MTDRNLTRNMKSKVHIPLHLPQTDIGLIKVWCLLGKLLIGLGVYKGGDGAVRTAWGEAKVIVGSL